MPTPSLSPPPKGIFYGWWVVCGCAFGYSTLCSIYWFGQMSFPQMEGEFGWTAADLGLLLGLTQFVSILWYPVTGWICERLGNRRAVFLFSSVLFTAVMLYPAVTKFWQMIILWPVVAGFGATGGGTIGMLTLPRKWFIKRAGLAMGIIGGFWGIFGALVFPAVTIIGSHLGWRTTLLYLVPGLLVLTWTIYYFLIWDSPETKGLHPDGLSDEELRKRQDALAGEPEEPFMTCRAALRTPQFWLLGIGYALTYDELGIMQGQSVKMATTYGISIALAGTAMSALLIPSILGRFGIGPLGDRFGRRKLILISGIVGGLIQFAGWKFVHNPTSLYVFMGSLGLIVMGGITLFPPLYGDLFGRKHLAGIMGWGGAIIGLISGITAILAGYIRDASGAYNLVYFMMGCLYFVQVVIMCFLKPTKVQLAQMHRLRGLTASASND